MYLWTCGSFKSSNHKKIGSANRRPAELHSWMARKVFVNFNDDAITREEHKNQSQRLEDYRNGFVQSKCDFT
jgi:hypothetical protein